MSYNILKLYREIQVSMDHNVLMKAMVKSQTGTAVLVKILHLKMKEHKAEAYEAL